MNLAELRKKIKRRETPFYDRLYRCADGLRSMEVPYVKGLHDLLYSENRMRIGAWRSFWRVVYHQPLFRSRCAECGKRLYIIHSGQGLPYIDGNLTIRIGDRVKLYDRVTLVGLSAGEHPTLRIGDGTEVTQSIAILVGNDVSIGANCIIGSSLIADNPGHNPDYKRRSQPVHRVLIGRVAIGDHVWAGYESIIVGNVSIGFGAVIGARAVVTKDVPPFCMVSGNPARIVYKLPFPKEKITELGEAEYQRYLSAEMER
jgi:acetyltransferase-like isoleucine patch superfamily enzyme